MKKKEERMLEKFLESIPGVLMLNNINVNHNGEVIYDVFPEIGVEFNDIIFHPTNEFMEAYSQMFNDFILYLPVLNN